MVVDPGEHLVGFTDIITRQISPILYPFFRKGEKYRKKNGERRRGGELGRETDPIHIFLTGGEIKRVVARYWKKFYIVLRKVGTICSCNDNALLCFFER